MPLENPTGPLRGLATALAWLLAAACAAPPPPPPPPAPVPVAVVDLGRIGRLGVVDFDADHGPSATAARQAFVDAVQALQPGATLVPLGPRADVLASVHATKLAPETIGAIGRRHGIEALLVAELETDPPDLREVERRLRTSEHLSVEGSLRLRIYDAKRGLPIWSGEASARQPLTRLRVNAWGWKRLEVGHLDEVRLSLVRELAAQASADFEPRLPAPATGTEPTEGPLPAKARAVD